MTDDANSVPNPDNGIGTRIAEVAEKLGSRKKSAEAAGVSVSTLNRWITGESVPVFAGVARLCLVAGVSLDWVATGSNSGEWSAKSEGAGEGVQAGQLPAGVSIGDYAFVPLYDAHCSSGPGAWNENCRVLVHLSFTRYSLRKKGLDPNHLSAIRNDGDSMYPLLDHEDTVLIDHTKTTIQGEGIYVIRLGDHLYAKKLQVTFDGVSVISENKSYERIHIPRDRQDELDIVGRAVWAAGWL